MTTFDFDEVLSKTATDVCKYFLRVFPLFLPIAVAMNLLNNALLGAMGQTVPEISLGAFVLLLCTSFFAFSIEIVVASQLLGGGNVRLGAACLQALRRFPVLFLVILGCYIIMMVGFLLLIIPGIIALVTLGYAWYLAVLDDAGPIDAVRGSFRLVWGNAWLVFSANLLWTLAYAIVVGAMFFILPGSFEELLGVLNTPAYGDWRRWAFEVAGTSAGIVYLFLNLNVLEELKRLKSDDSPSEAAESETVSA